MLGRAVVELVNRLTPRTGDDDWRIEAGDGAADAAEAVSEGDGGVLGEGAAEEDPELAEEIREEIELIIGTSTPFDLDEFLNLIPRNVTIVPKIESPEGITNVKEISDVLRHEKILMLDHVDLYAALLKNNKKDEFTNYLKQLSDFCKNNNITLLRTIGVIFADEEKRITDYVG